MADSFDPLHKWLGIPPAEQPPHHYRLLGLQLFESDPDVIANAADRQMAHVRTFQSGPQAAASQKLLNEISAAKLCLLKPDKRAEYDKALRRKLAESAPISASQQPNVLTPAWQPIATPAEHESLTWDAFEAVPARVLTPIRPSNQSLRLLVLAGGGVAVATLGLIVYLMFARGGDEKAAVVAPADRHRPPQPPSPLPSIPLTSAPAPAPPPRPVTRSTADVPGRSDNANFSSYQSSAAQTAASAPARTTSSAANSSAESPALAGPPAPASTEQETSARFGKRKTPDEAELAERRKKLKEMFQVEFASANTPADKVRLAETLLRQAVDAKDDDAGAYALWREALELGADAGSWPVVSEAVGSLDAAYGTEPLAILSAALVKLSGLARELSEKRAVANVALLVTDEAIDAEQFDTARQLLTLANGAAEATRDAALRARATAKDAEIKRLEDERSAAQAAADTLKRTADDRTANLTYGKHLCLVKRQWEEGLPLLLKSGDARLKPAAEAETSKPTFSADQMSLGDTWWELAESEDAPAKFVMRERAGYWYQQAWPKTDKTTTIGLEKRLMETRLPTTPAPQRASQVFVRGGSQPYPHTLTLHLGGPVSLKLRRVDAGSFLMGGSGSGVGRSELQHRVAIGRPYYLAATEITQAQWERVMAGNPSVMQGDSRRPAETISWDDCQTFVKRLNEAVGSPAVRFRMPTEAEWEYACRAGSATSYSFGDDPALLPQYAWVAANSAQAPHPVAQLLPNAWGFHDMYGNVAEWCYDFYSFDFYSSPSRLDPIGPAQGHARVIRGESFKAADTRRLRSFVRGDSRPDFRDIQAGFRVACDVTGPVSGP